MQNKSSTGKFTQPAIRCSKSTIETIEQGVKYDLQKDHRCLKGHGSKYTYWKQSAIRLQLHKNELYK